MPGGGGGHDPVFVCILVEFRADFNFFFWPGGGARAPCAHPWIRH